MVALALALSFTVAKSENFTNESFVVNFGVGLGTSLWSGAYYSMRIPPISISAEKGIYEQVGPGYIGVGGCFGIAGSKYRSTYYDANYTFITLSPRATYHLVMGDLFSSGSWEKFDFYGGLQVNINITLENEVSDYNYSGYSPSRSSLFHPGLFLGARYYFNSHFGAFSELGYNTSYITFGLSFKI